MTILACGACNRSALCSVGYAITICLQLDEPPVRGKVVVFWRRDRIDDLYINRWVSHRARSVSVAANIRGLDAAVVTTPRVSSDIFSALVMSHFFSPFTATERCGMAKDCLVAVVV